jgi:hypothetical protein
MSRAFRDTFKQTFCLCEKFVSRKSTVTITKHRKRHLNQSVACETVATYKCTNGDQTPIIQSLSDNNNKKKQTSIALQFC